MHNKNNHIISSDIYNGSSSLLDDIEYLSDNKNEVSEYKILNMVVKFLFWYYYLNSINLEIPFNEIINFFETITQVSNLKPEKEEIIKNIDEIEGFYHAQEYSLRMAMDIASTTKIIKDIISRVINKEVFDWKYLWMDLWSWTWILTLAQFIQAKRNNFDNITNLWFDLWYFVAKYSKRFLELLEVGTVEHQDTTKIELFQHIPQYQDITFITNETLCDPYLPVNWSRIHSDPFIENNQNIFNDWKVFLNDATEFFPEEVSVVDRNLFGYILDKENEFSYIKEWWEENWIFWFRDISICWELVWLEKVWQNLINEWLVGKLSNMSPRWCINRDKWKVFEITAVNK